MQRQVPLSQELNATCTLHGSSFGSWLLVHGSFSCSGGGVDVVVDTDVVSSTCLVAIVGAFVGAFVVSVGVSADELDVPLKFPVVFAENRGGTGDDWTVVLDVLNMAVVAADVFIMVVCVLTFVDAVGTALVSDIVADVCTTVCVRLDEDVTKLLASVADDVARFLASVVVTMVAGWGISSVCSCGSCCDGCVVENVKLAVSFCGGAVCAETGLSVVEFGVRV